MAVGDLLSALVAMRTARSTLPRYLALPPPDFELYAYHHIRYHALVLQRRGAIRVMLDWWLKPTKHIRFCGNRWVHDDEWFNAPVEVDSEIEKLLNSFGSNAHDDCSKLPMREQMMQSVERKMAEAGCQNLREYARHLGRLPMVPGRDRRRSAW